MKKSGDAETRRSAPAKSSLPREVETAAPDPGETRNARISEILRGVPALEEMRLTAPATASVPPQAETAAPPALRTPQELAPKVVEAIDLLTEWLGLQVPHPATAKRVRAGRTDDAIVRIAKATLQQ